ncbi:hypothetical protein CFK38_09550 [Brachybacterium vulturis]|uniref:DUF6457 domain-containing protein n=1 Tax=Brachybacterium vulturis TaxID=2017484 RepID=A0A291GNS9_9MICO|nr:DUF6457 domain-containing protein [Brachybacterium vulturis]ATG51740.1 hypothetical protein CFK38_09550 [Brachybacterium vulturis]
MATKPPVTLQEDWATTLQPWVDRVSAQLDVECVDLDVDRVHLMTGVVAEGVQRSMAPISAFLVGAAVARGASLEEACAAVEEATGATLQAPGVG